MGILDTLLGSRPAQQTAQPPRVQGTSMVPAFRSQLMATLRDYASPFLFGWTPVIREPIDETREAWYAAAARAIETIHNSGFIAGGVEQAMAQMVGSGLAINLKPEIGILGNADATEEWSRGVERRFEAWAMDPWACDLSGQQNLHQRVAHGIKQWYATGEIVGTIPAVERPGASHVTKINLVPSTRLIHGQSRDGRGVEGIIFDRWGAPVSYIFETRNIVTEQRDEIIVQARDEFGRKFVIHVFDGAPSQIRGISPMIPVLKVIKQYDQLSDATLTAALLQAIFAATVESPEMTGEVMRALQDDEEQAAEEPTTQPGDFDNLMMKRFEWYRQTNIDLGRHGKVIHMFPGEKLTLNRSEHPNTNYLNLAYNLMREIARCLGITFEQFSGNWEGSGYTSARMSISGIWPINLYRRRHLAAPIYQAVFDAWLEEDIIRGNTPFPGGIDAFLAVRARVSRADWRGPPKPSADDLKSAKAMQIARAEGWMTQEQGAAEYENDWRDVNEQQEREVKDREARGLPPLPSIGGGQQKTGDQQEGEANEDGAPPASEDEDE